MSASNPGSPLGIRELYSPTRNSNNSNGSALLSSFVETMQVLHNSLQQFQSTHDSRLEAESYLMRLQQSQEGLELALFVLNVQNQFENTIQQQNRNDRVEKYYFWCFNTIQYHIPLLAAQGGSNERITTLYSILIHFIHAYLQTQNNNNKMMILNKVSKVFALGITWLNYPYGWPTVFQDLFSLLENNNNNNDPCAVLFVLRVFESLDELLGRDGFHVINEIFHASFPNDENIRPTAGGNKKQEVIALFVAVKDAIKETVIPTFLSFIFRLLSENNTHQNNVEASVLALQILENYIEWINVNLLLYDSDWLNLLYFTLNQSSNVTMIKTSCVKVLNAFVNKKQTFMIKLESLQTLKILDYLPNIIKLLEADLNNNNTNNGSSYEFFDAIVELTTSIGEQFILLNSNASDFLKQNNNTEHNNELRNLSGEFIPLSPDVFQFMEQHFRFNFYLLLQLSSHPFMEQYDAVTAVDEAYLYTNTALRVMEYIKKCVSLNNGFITNHQNNNHNPSGMENKPFIEDEEATGIIKRCFELSIIKALNDDQNNSYTIIFNDNIILQRRSLYNITRSLYKYHSALIIKHMGEQCQLFFSAVRENNNNNNNNFYASVGFAEGLLKYIYEISICFPLDQIFKSMTGNNNNNNNTNLNGEEILNIIHEIISKSNFLHAYNNRQSQNEEVVPFAFFELINHFVPFFIYFHNSNQNNDNNNHNNMYLEIALDKYLLQPFGILMATNAFLRNKICHCFAQFLMALKNLLADQDTLMMDILVALESIVHQNNNNNSNGLAPEDKTELYNCIGTLVALLLSREQHYHSAPAETRNEKNNLHFKSLEVFHTFVSHPVKELQNMFSVLQTNNNNNNNNNNAESFAFIAHQLNLLTSLVRHITIFNNNETDVETPIMKSVGDIFFEMMKVILPLLQLTETCQTDNNNSNNMIRDALHPLIQQYINFLPFDKVYSIIYELYMKSIIYQNSNTNVLRFSVEEMNRLLKLLCQCLKKGQESFESNGSNEECLRDMIALLPPLFTTIVHTFGDINPFEKIKHNVISQMDKEMVEVHANFILYVFNVFSEESTALLFWTFAGQETLFFDALLTELGDGLCFPCNDLAIAAQSLRTIHKMICAHLSTWRGLEQAAAGGSPLPPLRYMYYSVLTNTADPTHPTAVSATKGYQQFQASLKNFIFPILLEKIISDFPLSVMGTDPAPAAKGNRTFNYKDMKNYIFLKEVVQLVRGLSFLFSPEMIHQLLMEILTTPYSNNNNNVVSSNLKNTVLRCLMEKRVKPEFVDSFVRFLVHNDNSKSDAPTTKTWNDAKQYDRVALLNYLSTFQNMLS